MAPRTRHQPVRRTPAARKGAGRFRVLGRGSNGAVLQAVPGWIYKWTTDPVEIKAFLVAAGMQNAGHSLRGLPHVGELWIGQHEGLILRPDTPAISRGGRPRGLFDDPLRGELQRAARAGLAATVQGRRSTEQRAFRQQQRALSRHPALRGVRDAVAELHKRGVHARDIRPPNLAVGADGLVLIDPGRTPVEATLNSGGEAWRRCPDEKALRKVVRQILGRAPKYSACHVLSARELNQVVVDHGWSRAEADGTAGFRAPDGRILLRRGDEWSLLHELVHAAGVLDKSLAVWATEGITEAVAQDIAAQRGSKHIPTYPFEVGVVHKALVPATGLSVIELGKLVALKPKGAAQALGARIAQRRGGRQGSWAQLLGKSSKGANAFKSAIQRSRVRT